MIVAASFFAIGLGVGAVVPGFVVLGLAGLIGRVLWEVTTAPADPY